MAWYFEIQQEIEPQNSFKVREKRSIISITIDITSNVYYKEVWKETYLRYSIEDKVFDAEIACLICNAPGNSMTRKINDEKKLESYLLKDFDLFIVDFLKENL